MAEAKKYFYMRLSEHFWDSDAMVAIESQRDGFAMANLLLKMYCRSLRNDGKLVCSEKIPYSPQMLATVTRIDIGIVQRALELFQRLELIEVFDSGTIFMLDIQQYIGQSSNEADRQREYRKRIAEERQRENDGGGGNGYE